MKILAFDSSTKKVGWSYWIDKELQDYGLLNFSKISDDYLIRCIEFRDTAIQMANEYGADLVTFEDTFLSTFGGKSTKGQVDGFKKLTKNVGILQAECYDEGYPTHVFFPSEWRKGLGFRQKRAQQKEDAIKYVNRVYGLDLKFVSPTSTKNDDDIAEAILIGRAASEIYG